MQWETVIGLEIHVQLATKSKLFSGAPTAYGAAPNTQACAVDLGLPGVLPVINREAIRMAVRFGVAVDADIAEHAVFARKNYFYPDLPKGYQISQFELPIVSRGHLDIALEDGSSKTVGITRAHLEEDAGKSVHEGLGEATGIDLNRAGTPLVEIVSEPDLRSAAEAAAYMRKIHTLVRYLGISDGNMQEGSFRCDANVSLRPAGESKLGTRAELKNINSFRFVEQAIEYEIERQQEILESGGTVVQETRLFDAARGETRSMRTKEEANDYRYFPCPDLLPLDLPETLVDEARASLPELPDAKRERFMSAFGLKDYDASVLTTSRELADYYERVVATGADAKLAANWTMVELLGALNKDGRDITASPISPENLGTLVQRIMDETISGKIAKQVFEPMYAEGIDPDTVIEREGLKQITDTSAIEGVVDEVISENEGQVQQYLDGKDKVLGFFVGQVMKKTGGKANPQQVNQIVKEKLDARKG